MTVWLLSLEFNCIDGVHFSNLTNLVLAVGILDNRSRTTSVALIGTKRDAFDLALS